MPDDATGIADSHHIRRFQVPNDHACANLSATVVYDFTALHLNEQTGKSLTIYGFEAR